MVKLSKEERAVISLYISLGRTKKYMETELPMYKFISVQKLGLIYKSKYNSELDRNIIRKLYDKEIVTLRHQGSEWYIGMEIDIIRRIIPMLKEG